MKKFLVYGKKSNGEVSRFECFAKSRVEAESKVLNIWGDLIEVRAFDYNIQFAKQAE